MREPSPRADPEARHVAVWLAPWRALLARRQAERFRLEAAEAAAAQAAHARLERRTALGIQGLPESIATDIRALIPPLLSPLLRLLASPCPPLPRVRCFSRRVEQLAVTRGCPRGHRIRLEASAGVSPSHTTACPTRPPAAAVLPLPHYDGTLCRPCCRERRPHVSRPRP